MKKVKFFAMSMMLMGALATLFLTSCSKTEDVDYNDASENIINDVKVGGGLTLHCPLCGADVPPSSHCEHIYDPGECPIGPTFCNKFDKHHHHIFWNWYHDGNEGLHTETTTHCGGSFHNDNHTI